MILNKENSERLIKHMNEDKPNDDATESLIKGRKILSTMSDDFKKLNFTFSEEMEKFFEAIERNPPVKPVNLDLETVAFMLFLGIWTDHDSIIDFDEKTLGELYVKWNEEWLPSVEEPHFGDCNGQPVSCTRCHVEDLYEDARKIVNATK